MRPKSFRTKSTIIRFLTQFIRSFFRDDDSKASIDGSDERGDVLLMDLLLIFLLDLLIKVVPEKSM